MRIVHRSLLTISNFPRLCLKILFIVFFLQIILSILYQLYQLESVNIGSPRNVSSKNSSKTSLLSDRPAIIRLNGSNYVRQLHLCLTDFQRSLELNAFNRTLVLYEAEWRHYRQLNLLFILVESTGFPTVYIGDMTPQFAKIYSIQCLYRSKTSKGELRHVHTHEYDRTVIIHCENNQIDENNNSYITLLFTELATGKISSMNIALCWSLSRRVTIGHCHKAFFDDVPIHMIKQWLDYHLLIGIEQFYMYDRTLKYKSLLQSYMNRGQVIYIPFPLAKQVVGRERFNWIDQFVGKMHCLMHIRSAFEWLGTWDIDEYLNFYTDQQQQIFLPNCKSPQKNCPSMLSEYLNKNFQKHNNIMIYGLNYFSKISLNTSKNISTASMIMERFQYRLTIWNDRVKYLTRPMHTTYINIHFALYITNNLTYECHLRSPSLITSKDQRTLIHINHYPSAMIQRDDDFLRLHRGKIEYIHDPTLWQVATKLHKEKNKKRQKSSN